MPSRDGIFPTFFLSGFECSTFVWKDRGRRDLVAETRHAEHVDGDYAFLRGLGIAVARQEIPWPFVDTRGTYDFSRLDPFIAAMNRHQILPIWDLCHYGYPDDVDPFADDFAERFAAYAKAAAEYVTPRIRGRWPAAACRRAATRTRCCRAAWPRWKGCCRASPGRRSAVVPWPRTPLRT